MQKQSEQRSQVPLNGLSSMIDVDVSSKLQYICLKSGSPAPLENCDSQEAEIGTGHSTRGFELGQIDTQYDYETNDSFSANAT